MAQKDFTHIKCSKMRKCLPGSRAILAAMLSSKRPAWGRKTCNRGTSIRRLASGGASITCARSMGSSLVQEGSDSLLHR